MGSKRSLSTLRARVARCCSTTRSRYVPDAAGNHGIRDKCALGGTVRIPSLYATARPPDPAPFPLALIACYDHGAFVGAVQAQLACIENLLARATTGTARGNHHQPVAFEADALAAHAAATHALKQLEPRARVFERRATERDPDKRIYGTKMSRRVLEFCDAMQSAVASCFELGEALEPARRRRAEAEKAAAAAATAAAAAAALDAAAEAATEAARREASEAAAVARAREEEIARRTEAEAEAEARRRRPSLTAVSAPNHVAQMDLRTRGSPSQWPEVEDLSRKMARVMPRASTSW